MKKKMLLLMLAVAFCFADDVTSDGNLAMDSSGYYVLNTYEDLAAFATMLKNNYSPFGRQYKPDSRNSERYGLTDIVFLRAF